MQFLVKTIIGKTITLDILENTTVFALKEKLAVMEGSHSDMLRLICNGKELMNEDLVIVTGNEQAHIHSVQFGHRLNFSNNSISAHLIERATFDPLSVQSIPTVKQPVPMNFLSLSYDLWRRNQVNFIGLLSSTVGAAAIVFSVLFSPKNVAIKNTLDIRLLTTAGGLSLVATFFLLKIIYKEWHVSPEARSQNREAGNQSVSMNQLTLPRGWLPSKTVSTPAICELPIENTHLTLREQVTSNYYIMLDHGGVLSGEPYEGVIEDLDFDDLVLSEVYPGLNMVLKGGLTLLNRLSELIKYHNCKLVFHSKNRESDQRALWQQIKIAAEKKGAELPHLHAMVIYDASQYSNSKPSAPLVTFDGYEGSIMIAYGREEGDGKSCVRQALSKAFGIDHSSRGDCIVFDDGTSVVAMARREGYQAYWIGSEVGAFDLTSAIEDLYIKIIANKKQSSFLENITCSIKHLGMLSFFSKETASSLSSPINSHAVTSTETDMLYK